MQTTKQVIEEGKTYVAVGFVDNSIIMNSELLTPWNEMRQAVKFVGIDMSPICVARSLIIYEMMKRDCSADNIFELWYLSCISKATNENFKDTIKAILGEQQVQKEVEELLHHWLASAGKLTVAKAKESWFATTSTAGIYPASNLVSENARVTFCRYKLAGTIKKDNKYLCGNPTFFDLPSSFSDHFHTEDDLFNSVDPAMVIDVEGFMGMG